MTTKKNTVMLLIVCVLIGAGATWWYRHNSAAAVPENPEAVAEAVSALIKTQKIEQQNVDSIMLAFGDVLSAKTDTLSFPQAGQITVLLVQPGQQVKSGETLAILNTDPSVFASYKQAASALDFARAELKREEELFALKLLTQTQLDTAKKQLSDAEANLASQKKLGGEFETARLTAPTDGVITALVAGQGDRLAAGSAVVQMGESGRLRIQLGVEPSMRRRVKPGMAVTFAPIQNPAQTITAKISEIQNIIDPKTQLVNAIIMLPSSTSVNLIPGMRVQSSIHVGQQQAWLAPRSAVLSDEKGSYIFQVASGKAKRIEVSKMSETATHFAIEGEIDPKLPLVVLGNYELEDDMPVRESAK